MRVIEPEIELLVAAKNLCGETPVWHRGESALYWIDCDGHLLLRWDEAYGEVKRWSMPERVGGITLKKGGGALVTLASGLFDFDFASETLVKRITSPQGPHVAMHESAVDPAGRFWVGGINHKMKPGNMNPGGANLYRLDGDQLIREISGLSCANGLAFSPDGKLLYVSDSPTQRCDRYAIGANGTLGPRETFFELKDGEGFVDGSTVDSEGFYWATMVSVGKLRRYRPDGTPELEVKLPFNNPTKVGFGGRDLKRLFITSMSLTLGGTNPLALDGGLFAFDVEVAGLPEPMLNI
jgi:sugar lactone lactonase YvrE